MENRTYGFGVWLDEWSWIKQQDLKKQLREEFPQDSRYKQRATISRQFEYFSKQWRV